MMTRIHSELVGLEEFIEASWTSWEANQRYQGVSTVSKNVLGTSEMNASMNQTHYVDIDGQEPGCHTGVAETLPGKVTREVPRGGAVNQNG
jgi:hypothetical protein